MRNILLTIEYDGTRFLGWQRQPDCRTVCGTVEEALSVLFGFPVKIDGTSRTDAGVHARGQRATLRVPDDGIPTDKIAYAANSLLAPDKVECIGDVRILKAEEMPEGFHARHSCTGKRYIYKIFNSPEKSVFRRTQFYQIGKPLNLDAMRKAAAYIIGEHDFACFQTSGSNKQDSTVREIYKLDITEKDGLIEITVEGNRFLYNMVRIIVGTLVEVGLGKRSPEDLPAIIESKNRGKAGHLAPPQGLYLDEVFYGE